MISSKSEGFKEGPEQVRGSRPGPRLSWQSHFCRNRRGRSKATVSPGSHCSTAEPKHCRAGFLHPAQQCCALLAALGGKEDVGQRPPMPASCWMLAGFRALDEFLCLAGWWAAGAVLQKAGGALPAPGTHQR